MDSGETDPFAEERARLLEEVDEEMRRTAKWTGRRELKPEVRTAIARVPRHRFVAADMTGSAYVNRPLGIGHGQTISQPFIVALMTEMLDLPPGAKVLEVGTGSGYQAAVLAEIAGAVYTVEVVPSLSQNAQGALRRIGYRNIHFRIGNGRDGWPEEGPFPAIMVTAAAESIPERIVGQLAPGGRMILPVGRTNGPQNLVLVTKALDGAISKTTVLSVAFVPLVGA